MKTLLFAFIFVTLFKNSWGQEFSQPCMKEFINSDSFSFQNFNKSVNGRENQLLFRGIKNDWEITPKMLWESLFEESLPGQKSFAFSLYEKELLDNGKSSGLFRSYIKKYELFDLFESIKSCIQLLKPEEKEIAASFGAKKILDTHFLNREQNGQLISRYIDDGAYRLDQINWNNVDYCGYGESKLDSTDKFMGRGELIFGSYDSSVSQMYYYFGNILVVYSEKANRQLDSNQWHRNKYGQTVHHPNDQDEFVLPGYALSKEVLGFYLLNMGNSIYFIERNNEYKSLFIYKAELPNGEVSSSEKLRKKFSLIGYFSDQKFDDEQMKLVLKQLNVNQSLLENEGEILNLKQYFLSKFNNQFTHQANLNFFYKNPPSLITIVSASAGDRNILKEVSDYCNNKVTCNYKIAQKFLNLNPPLNETETFKLEYKCKSSDGKWSEVKEIKIDPSIIDKRFTLTCE